MKTRYVTAGGCHSYSDHSIHQRWATVTKQKSAHKFRQAAQLRRLKNVEFAIETGPFSARRFLFLLEGKSMQFKAIQIELKPKKGVNAIRWE
jgi:hypothetical protein